MRHPRLRFRAGLIPLGFALLLLAGPAAGGDEAPAPLEAGFATVDLTPEHPAPLAGYAGRLGTDSKGVHDPIEAHAIVIRQGGTSLALVALDMVGVSREVREVVDARVADLGLDELVLAATHTHHGPGALTRVPLWHVATGSFDPALFARTAARIEAAIRRAYADLSPARIAAGRFPAPGLVRNRRRAEGGVDDTVGVVRIDGPGGACRGAIVHFAAHPVILPYSEKRFSAAWPGALRRSLSRQLDGAPVLFLQGAVGDVSPIVPSDGGYEPFARAEAYGEALAGFAARGIQTLAPQAHGPGLRVDGTTAAAAHTVAGRLLGRPTEGALAPRSPWLLPVTRFGLAGIECVTVPGEPVQAVARTMGQSATRWIVGCAQDHLGYFADRAMYRRADAYEAEMSFFGPDVAEALARAANGEAPEIPQPSIPAPRPVVVGAGSGTAHDLGRDHGRRLRAEIRDLLEAAEGHIVREALKHGAGLKLLPSTLLSSIPARDLVVPLLVRAARGLQRHIPDAYLDEMEGVAAAAGVPYDAILLENVFLTLAEQPDPGALLSLPVRCTNAVVGGDATSMGQLLHLSTLDWGMGDVLGRRVTTLIVRPPTGHPFVSVTWPGMVGTLRAMGAQGIAVTEESTAAPADDTRLAGLPVNLLMRDVAQHATDLDDAVRRVQEAPGTCGYKLTISDGRELDARVVEVTATRSHVRTPSPGGLLFGCEPNAPADRFVGARDEGIRRGDGSSARRYPALARVLAATPPGRLREANLLAAITSKEGGILGSGTLLACAFEPQFLRFHVSAGRDLRPGPGRPAAWTTDNLLRHLSEAERGRYAPPWPVTEAGPSEVRTRIVSLGGVRVDTVRLTSTIRSGHPGNDVFEAELFLPENPAGAVIQLPHWKEPRGAPGQRLVAAGLARQGVAVLLLPLPYQYGRAPSGQRSGAWTLSSNLARTREAALQGVADVARASHWLETQGFAPDRQAVLGTSLGGHIASLALGAYPDRFAGGVLILASADVAGTLMRKNGITDGIRRRLIERGVTIEEARTMLEEVDPSQPAGGPFAERILIIAGDEDPITPKHEVEALARLWGGARIHWFAGGHYEVVRHAATVLHASLTHLKAIFETP